jgi:Spy/CpxP family protein refolding chaperone
MKKISVIAAFLLLVASATWVMAGPRGMGGWSGDTWCPAASQLSTLNLSTEQSEKVRALRASFLKETTPIRTQLFTKGAELRLLWIQTNLDAAKIRPTQKEMNDLMGQMQEKSTDFRLAFRNLLTPEQTTQFLAQGVCRSPGSDWGKGKGPGPGKGPGDGSGDGPGAGPGRGPGSCR